MTKAQSRALAEVVAAIDSLLDAKVYQLRYHDETTSRGVKQSRDHLQEKLSELLYPSVVPKRLPPNAYSSGVVEIR